MNLIALMGKAKSGKDTVGTMLTELAPGQAKALAFADKLKETCMDLFGLSWDDVYTEEGKARTLDLICNKCPACSSIRSEQVTTTQRLCLKCGAVGDNSGFASFWTPRAILQHVGTEGARFVDDNVWVKFALRAAARALEGHGTPRVQFVTITDCRFKSEAEAVWRAGGEVWRLRRPSTDNTPQGLAGHSSETEMDTIPDNVFQAVIHNDSSLDQLRGKVSQALLRFRETRFVSQP